MMVELPEADRPADAAAATRPTEHDRRRGRGQLLLGGGLRAARLRPQPLARGPATSSWPCSGPATTSSTSRARRNCSTRSSTTPSACSTPSAARSCWPRAPDEPSCKLRALATGRGRERAGRFHFSPEARPALLQPGASRSCARSVDETRSCHGQSIADGAMASVLCVLLRTPRKQPRRLHLDRSYWQKPFTEDDLHLADALAAHVSAGIEVRQLLRKQRELFLNTITILAQAVELRDEYTGGHTAARDRTTRCCWPRSSRLSAKDRIDLIRIGSPLHDIGKIGIDDAILRKPGKLTADEFEIMKTHTTLGRRHPQDHPGAACHPPDRPVAPRALGRPGLPGQAGRRGDPAVGPRRGRGRRLRRHDDQAAVQHEPRQDAGAGVRGSGTLQRAAVRPEVRPAFLAVREKVIEIDAVEPHDRDVLRQRRATHGDRRRTRNLRRGHVDIRRSEPLLLLHPRIRRPEEPTQIALPRWWSPALAAFSFAAADAGPMTRRRFAGAPTRPAAPPTFTSRRAGPTPSSASRWNSPTTWPRNSAAPARWSTATGTRCPNCSTSRGTATRASTSS